MTDIKTLYILRHAKADWPDDVADKDRPLAEKGRRDAQKLGLVLADNGLHPAVIFCSSALRTRETCEAVRGDSRVVLDDALYQATTGQLFEYVKNIDPAAASAMLVGHNPGIHGIAHLLCGRGERHDMESLATTYAPGTLAIVDLPVAGWRDAMPGCGTLRALMTAKQRA